MDYYPSSSSSRGRSSYRGSSYRSRGDSYRGSRGSRGGSSRGRGGSSSYTSKYETSTPKYSSSIESSKYGSYGKYEDSYRRSDSSFGHRSELSEISSRKRERPDSYSSSQGITRRHEDEEYRTSRYSGSSYSEHRGYDESRAFKKPRSEFKSPSEYRVKEPLRTRSTRGRVGMRGSASRRGARDSFTQRRRPPFSSRSATTSEILAIRRAKLLQNRLKEQSAIAESKEKAVKKEEGEVEESPKTEKSAAENGEAKKEEAPKEERERTNYYGRPFMKLQCPNCEIKCVTFKEYTTHLHLPVHVRAMKEKSDSLKTALAAMRISQREEQRKADEEDLTSMTTRSLFCSICKLNYSQERATHQASELHKKLKEFLMPYCKICRIQFESPMLHETHLCSLEHLRRKNDLEERDKKSSSRLLDKFMVLDSVGSGDEVDEKEEEEEGVKVEKDKELMLGWEFIHDVKAKYCEVCRCFLPRVRNYERVLKRHCETKEHLRCYLHYGNEALLEKMNADADGDVSSEKKDEKSGEGKEGESEEPLDGDKLWDGLSELLDDAQQRAKSDDDDEEEGGRFDRFKSKEQKENGSVSVVEAGEKQGPPAEEAPKAAVAET